MILPRLTATGFVALTHQWRDLWNGVIRDSLESSRLVAGSGISLTRTPSGTVISAVRRSTASVPVSECPAPYNGEFKLVHSTVDDSEVVKLIDGSDPTSGYAGYSDIGRVPVLSAEYAASRHYFLVPTWDELDSVYGFSLEARDEPEASEDDPEGAEDDPEESAFAWYIGRTDASGVLIQGHVTGRIYFGTRWFV